MNQLYEVLNEDAAKIVDVRAVAPFKNYVAMAPSQQILSGCFFLD
jgi:hypothetical protein